jgi:prepilin-type N-terminal cleavage/methylation domain-containing protein
LRGGRDAGFTLAEVMVSISLISVTMAALTPFFISAMSLTDHQRTRQVAIQIAGDGVERARALNGSALLVGRGQTASTAQWNGAPAPVEPYLDTLSPAWDPDPLLDPGAGADAPLPTKALTVAIGGKQYEQQWYLGRCRQQGGPTGGADRDCTPVDDPDPDSTRPDVPMFGLVVAVTWTHRTCPADECVYVASTLFSSASDPVFNTERPPPTVDVGDQYSYVGSLVSMQLTALGGQLPLTWTVTGLPAGLEQLSAGSSVVSGTPTTPGPYPVLVPVLVKVTDRVLDSDEKGITWHVGQLPALSDPGAQVDAADSVVAVPFAGYLTGGHANFRWSATGLPAGLAIDEATGIVRGTPATPGPAQNVRLTVADRTGKSAFVDFTWRIADAMTAVDRSTDMGDSVSVTLTSPEGLTPARWWAENLPSGLDINEGTGRIFGTAEHGTRFLTTVHVANAGSTNEAAVTFVWRVPPDKSNDMRITVPNPAAPDQSTQAGTSVTLPVAADQGSNSGYTWVATGLPPGLSIAKVDTLTARISGTVGAPGNYTVTIVATDSPSKSATIMFIWTVTP